MTAPTLLLNDGYRIPQIDLGTWPLNKAALARMLVTATALDTSAKPGVAADMSGH
jgi:hypothetical protein